MKKCLMLLGIFFSCATGIPEGITPIDGFELNRYLGKWYEIARLDHSFERGLNNVTAEYSLREDGGVKVVNRGFNPEKKEWEEAAGKAYFTGESNTGSLKVTFFWPFYGGYNIIGLDRENYSYSLVCGPDRSYLWILCRDKSLKKEIQDKLLWKAKELGFDTDKLIFVEHSAE